MDFSPKSSAAMFIRFELDETVTHLVVSEPTVFENYVHDLYVDDQLVELSLWDTAGRNSHVYIAFIFKTCSRARRVRPAAIAQLCRDSRHYAMLLRECKLSTL